MSKFECTNSRCIYGCKLEVNGQKKAPEKCQYTGMETHWVRVESEQFGNSEQIKGVEMFRGFKVPKHDDLQCAVHLFNTGEDAFDCCDAGCSFTDNTHNCDECIFCCNCGDRDAKINAFAEYARSKGYTITRPGCGEETQQELVDKIFPRPKLTADIFNRPDCPEWAEYAAVDESGEAWFFAFEPFVDEENHCFACQTDDYQGCQHIAEGYDATDWQNSLIQRERQTSDGVLHVRFKRLHPDAKAPYQATPGSAGFDLTAVSREEIGAFYTKYDTGLAVEIPAGHVGLVFPRSSIYKTETILTNSVGVIDSDYRGAISAVFAGRMDEKEYKVGDRIAQLVIMPIPAVKFVEAEELSDTERGAGGYGSTGK